MANISGWPKRQPAPPARQLQTLYGRRRLDWFSRHDNGFATELRKMPLIKELQNTRWACKGIGGGDATVELSDRGDARGLPSGSGLSGFVMGKVGRAGRWGSMNDPTLGEACPLYSCIFIDANGAQHEGRLSESRDSLTVMSHSSLEVEWRCTKT
jgi:hypothetical protein